MLAIHELGKGITYTAFKRKLMNLEHGVRYEGIAEVCYDVFLENKTVFYTTDIDIPGEEKEIAISSLERYFNDPEAQLKTLEERSKSQMPEIV